MTDPQLIEKYSNTLAKVLTGEKEIDLTWLNQTNDPKINPFKSSLSQLATKKKVDVISLLSLYSWQPPSFLASFHLSNINKEPEKDKKKVEPLKFDKSFVEFLVENEKVRTSMFTATSKNFTDNPKCITGFPSVDLLLHLKNQFSENFQKLDPLLFKQYVAREWGGIWRYNSEIVVKDKNKSKVSVSATKFLSFQTPAEKFIFDSRVSWSLFLCLMEEKKGKSDEYPFPLQGERSNLLNYLKKEVVVPKYGTFPCALSNKSYAIYNELITRTASELDDKIREKRLDQLKLPNGTYSDNPQLIEVSLFVLGRAFF